MDSQRYSPPVLVRYTKKKVAAVLRTVEIIRQLDFPYSDSSHALVFVEGVLRQLADDIDALGPHSDSKVIHAVCQRSLEAIQYYLPILGFIVRSTDLDGPVELQGPLLRLTHKAIGSSAKLIISSEWEFSPFTILYPELSDRDFVLVGMPCSEATNALVAPLAGHELGHNVWAKLGHEKKFDTRIRDHILDEVNRAWPKWAAFFGLSDQSQLTDLVGDTQLHMPWSWAMAQCEEMFCDFIGLGIFRESYLHAFQYLLAPGLSGSRSYRYPRLADRIRMLTDAASKGGITLPDNYADTFSALEDDPDPGYAQLGRLADVACSKLSDALFAEATQFVQEKRLCDHDPNEADRIYKTLKRAVPATGSKSISDILSGAWKLALDDQGFLSSEYPGISGPEQEVILNELVLKNFEVFEIEQRQARL